MVTGQQVNPSHKARVFMGTITGGGELHPALTQAAKHFDIHTGTVQLIGDLTGIEFTAFDFTAQERLPPVAINGALEIVGGQGTISLMADSPHIHLHLVVAYRSDSSPNGIALAAGHVGKAQVYAVEYVMTAFAGPPVERGIHARTGLNLWNLPTISL